MQKSLALSYRVPVKEGYLTSMRSLIPLLATASLLFGDAAFAQSQYESSTDFAKYAMKLRENALLKVEPKVIMSPTRTTFTGDGPRYQTGPSLMGRSNGLAIGGGRYPWKLNIVTTIFWVGERPSGNNPVPNDKSSWDKYWSGSYGGYDNPDPAGRRNYIPVNFVPRQNPFYVALPYNDVEGGHTKPEAAQVIPWFKQSFVRDGQTVLKSRWIAIRHNGRVCYAQWEDAGPFRTDHWQYVFGNERPLSNQNHDAGIDLSPAVRDFLNIGGMDSVDWKFVEFSDVPTGPWTRLGDNNPFVQQIRNSTTMVVRRDD